MLTLALTLLACQSLAVPPAPLVEAAAPAPPAPPAPTREPSTAPSPTCNRISSIAAEMIACGVQLAVAAQISMTKARKSSMPRGLWCTSGWNCTPYRRRFSSYMAAMLVLLLVASATKPAGSVVT